MGALIGGALSGALGGAMSNQKEGGKDVGNVYGSMPGLTGQALGNTSGAMTDMNFLSSYASPGSQLGTATGEVQSNPILGQMYGQGGLLSRTLGEEQGLAGQGFSLTNDDKTAYGQASGDITRQFGESDQGLSQALSDRGLSNSGVAGAAFTGSQGNKNEQLAKLQTNIAQNRMQMNQQRLQATRSFLGQLGGQAQDALNSRITQGMQGQQLSDQHAQQKYNMGMGLLSKYQGQQNEGLGQQQQTEHSSGLSNALQGGMSGASAFAGMGGSGESGMSGSTTNLSAGAPSVPRFSDRRLKKNIIELAISLFRDVPTYLFQYLDPSMGQGWQVGVMAQDLIAINPNHPAVIRTSKGYMVNYGRL